MCALRRPTLLSEVFVASSRSVAASLPPHFADSVSVDLETQGSKGPDEAFWFIKTRKKKKILKCQYIKDIIFPAHVYQGH